MADYIDRNELVENLDRFAPEHFTPLIRTLIEKQPTADVEEVKHGEWNECFEDWRKQIAGDECSVCGFQHYGTSISDYNYCPNCGADMRGAKDE